MQVPPDQRGHTEPGYNQGCALHDAFRPVRRQINHTATSRLSTVWTDGAPRDKSAQPAACGNFLGNKRELLGRAEKTRLHPPPYSFAAGWEAVKSFSLKPSV